MTYVLEDNAFRIALSRSSATSVPMAYVKVSAHLLASAQPREIETSVRAMLGELGLIQGPPRVSRIDLYVDFTSACDMESWDRNAWVGRAANVHFHAVDGMFSGWSLGLRGPISARLYDKTLEITVSCKQWITELWRERGWNGTDRVWRLEFQLRRDVLDSLTSVEFAAMLNDLPSIWTYCTVDWLRLCIPNPADSTRARWPLHPLWAAMQQIDWGAPAQPLSRQFRSDRAPQAGHVLRQVMGWVCTFLALRGVYELGPGLDLLANELNWHLSERAQVVGIAPRQLVFEQVAKRVRKFNLDMNSDVLYDEDQERRQADELAHSADAYGRASRGY